MGKLGSVAIIGAGISGLSCAQALRSAGVDVRIFERTSQVGGRCATRLWQGHLVDQGVQYFTAESVEFKKELLTRLKQFRPIISPILDHEDKVVPSAAGPRFYVLQGNNYFAHVLSQGLDLRLDTAVEAVVFRPSGAECLGEMYDAVIGCLPGPQTTRLFGLPHSPADYDPCLTALVEYAGAFMGQSRECYGKLLPEGDDPVLFSSCENHKAGRVVGAKTVFVVQGAPRFSRAYADAPPETYLRLLIRRHEELWQIPSGLSTASSGRCWLQARSNEKLRHHVDLPAGAFICGDSRVESTIESVWADGCRAAQEVLVYLAS